MKAIVVFAWIVCAAAVVRGQVTGINGGPMYLGCGSGGGSAGGGANGVAQINGTGLGFPGRATAIGALSSTIQADPMNCALLRRLNASYRGTSSGGNTHFTRVFIDRNDHKYFGYEAVLAQRAPGEYQMSFGQPGITPMEAAIKGDVAGPIAANWGLRSIALPESRIVYEGDTIDVELLLDPASGLKMVDTLKIEPYSSSLPRPGLLGAVGLPPQSTPTVPTVQGTARDFTAADAEMALTSPRVTINGVVQSAPKRVTGPLLWVYVPGHGRYILSLAPRTGLDFKLAGEVRGGKATFTDGTDSISLENYNEIAPGTAPYRLYISSDRQWEPTSESQKSQLAIGSVGIDELLSLNRK